MEKNETKKQIIALMGDTTEIVCVTAIILVIVTVLGIDGNFLIPLHPIDDLLEILLGYLLMDFWIATGIRFIVLDYKKLKLSFIAFIVVCSALIIFGIGVL